ncbi:Replication protein 15 [Lentibacillus sp. JNUCC-1]|uniref:DNA replication protein DnaD n=1 Tax=Lentibacillus sp. JNUCC-1 TaxID=2654513 RepID=UPI0012E7B40B|nr:DNA replication protein DnaD [Lentibacillus sp. JNUCC-1]MUV39444.1 Replication protein 15 [Lentibacillus sp. JNUCC-1]
MRGWIKVHRELMDKAIWIESTTEQKTILITLLMMANHDKKEWEFKGKKYAAEPGQFVTSIDKIAKLCGKGVSRQNVRTALNRFKKYDFLTDESTNQNRLITIVNWGLYQSRDEEVNKQTNKQLTSNQHAANTQLTPNKNDKNDKNDKKKDSRKRIYDDTSIYYQLALYFYQQIQNNNPNHKKPNLQNWADDVRKMIEIDKRTEKQVKYLMTWVQQDEFEMVNVLSPAKLRKRFDGLIMKVKRDRQSLPPNVTPINDKYNYGF